MPNILDIEMQENDADAKTIRDYLKKLLITLWNEGEGFSGKRPFGNSSWEYEVYIPLIKAGVVKGTLDEDGYVDEFSTKEREKADKIIIEAIGSL